MILDNRLSQVEKIFNAAVNEAYERGRKDALAAIMLAASAQVKPSSAEIDQRPISKPHDSKLLEPNFGRVRAPRGSVEVVIKRTIENSGGNGASVREMMESRVGDGEMMIVDSSIRSQLRRGQRSGEYIEINERWFLANS